MPLQGRPNTRIVLRQSLDALQGFKRNWEIWGAHLSLQGVHQVGVGSLGPNNVDGVTGVIGQAEEGYALDMVPMRVAKEDRKLQAAILCVAELPGKVANASPRIDKQQFISSPQLKAGRVATVFDGLLAGHGNRAPDAPKTSLRNLTVAALVFRSANLLSDLSCDKDVNMGNPGMCTLLAHHPSNSLSL